MQVSASDTTPSSQKEKTSVSAPPENRVQAPVRDDPLPYVLARHKSEDCYFDVRLTRVELTYFHGKRLVHQLSFRLDLARPFEDSKRIRAAQLTINVANQSGSSSGPTPEILAITPEASLIHIADHEITTGQTVGVTAGAPPAAGATLAANANLSWGDKTTFKGNRLVHGYIPSSTQAQWKMYEETRSQSGLPPVLYFLIVLRAPQDFVVTANLHIRRWTGWGFLGMRKQVAAESVRNGYLVRKELLDEPGEKAFQVSDDLLKLLDESDKKREVLEDLLHMHFPQLTRAKEMVGKSEDGKKIGKKGTAILGDARKEVEEKFALWREMAETEEQQDALTMLYGIADKMLGVGTVTMTTVIEPISRHRSTRRPVDAERSERYWEEHRRQERRRVAEEIGWNSYRDNDREEDRYQDREYESRRRPENTESRRNNAVFGKKSQTAEEALATHQAVSSAWAERKL